MRIAIAAIAAVICLACGLPEAAARDIIITVDKSAQRMIVEIDGIERYNWPVSTGRLGRDTPEGAHRAFRLERDHYSREWDDAPMPHSIFFTKTGHAIHGSYDVKKIGQPASAGCVRLAPQNAATLFALVEERGVLNTTVVITGDVRVALARQQRYAARENSTEPPSARRAPTSLDPNVYARPNPFSNDVYGRRRPPDAQRDGEPFEAYVERMRQRYQRQRAQAQPPPQYYDDARTYYGYDGRVYRFRRYEPGW